MLFICWKSWLEVFTKIYENLKGVIAVTFKKWANNNQKFADIRVCELMRTGESECANVTSANLPLPLPWVNIIIILILSKTQLSLILTASGALYVFSSDRSSLRYDAPRKSFQGAPTSPNILVSSNMSSLRNYRFICNPLDNISLSPS